MTTPMIEICVDSPASIAAAAQGGADRLELCAALPLGGLTPGVGLMAAARSTGLPIAAMARPRAGGLVLDPEDLTALLVDISALVDNGADAIVCGACTAEHALDVAAMSAMVETAGDIPVVLHRAIDLVADWHSALESAVDLGIRRILTSGGASTAATGLDRIAAMVEAAGGRIEIMAGGGIRPEHVADIACLGIDAIHGSASQPGKAHSAEAIGIPPHSETSVDLVRAMRRALTDAGAVA
ncbi:copper homeostasis protein CutC [Gymnodinialimonas sp. 2305UL16-5]|uniref:copper homeostasis protein CutC n=1 Tax=Gymnodinialimonas mytili TaxID=3126503 RepID=UPI0030B647AE